MAKRKSTKGQTTINKTHTYNQKIEPVKNIDLPEIIDTFIHKKVVSNAYSSNSKGRLKL